MNTLFTRDQLPVSVLAILVILTAIAVLIGTLISIREGRQS